jgi:hypothetical protein
VLVDVVRALRKLFDLLIRALRGDKDQGRGKNKDEETEKKK